MITVLLMLSTSESLGQISQASKKINEIKGMVKRIDSAPLEKIVFQTQKMPDSIRNRCKTYKGLVQEISAFYANGTLRHLKLQTYGIYPTSTDYYFYRGTLIYVSEKYHNNARMGSCGDITIENLLYYQAHTLIGSQTIESPFSCYHDPIQRKLILADLKNVLDFMVTYRGKRLRI